MRPPSASLVAALASLHAGCEARNHSQVEDNLAEIESTLHPAAIIGLAPLTLSTDRSLAHRAARRIHSVLSRLDEDGILWLAREGRRFYVSTISLCRLWEALSPANLHELEMFADASVALLCVGTLHRSGYFRQACVQRLSLRPGKLAMAFLLLRVNDWVKPIRAQARLAIVGRLLEARQGDLGRCRELLENLLLSDYIDSWGRDDHRPIRDAIDTTLMSDAFEVVLEEGFASRRPSLQGRVYQLALERSKDNPSPIIFRAIASRNGANRCWAARQATKLLSGSELQRIVDIMRNDSLPVIRHEAVFALATKLPGTDPMVLVDFLLDPGADVRFLAAYYLSKQKFDVRAHYLNALKRSNEPNLAAIVTGIGEKGKPGDEQNVAPLLTHSNPLVRAAAVFTIGKLGYQHDMDWIFAALRDPHKLVVRAAAKQLVERAHVVDAFVIRQWLATETRSSLQRQAIRIGARMERWEALEFLLDAAQTLDHHLRLDIEIELRRWLHRFVDWYTPPNIERLARLQNAHAGARGVVSDDVLKWIGGRLAVYQKH